MRPWGEFAAPDEPIAQSDIISSRSKEKDDRAEMGLEQVDFMENAMGPVFNTFSMRKNWNRELEKFE